MIQKRASVDVGEIYRGLRSDGDRTVDVHPSQHFPTNRSRFLYRLQRGTHPAQRSERVDIAAPCKKKIGSGEKSFVQIILSGASRFLSVTNVSAMG